MEEQAIELPPMPIGKYQWWDDYYEGLTLSEEPEERYRALGLYDEDQMQAYARAAVLQERQRCAKVCDDMERQEDNDHGSANTGGAARCANAIRKG